MASIIVVLCTVLAHGLVCVLHLNAQQDTPFGAALNHEGQMTATNSKQTYLYATRSAQQGDVCTRITEYFAAGNNPSGKAFARIEVRYKIPTFETLEERFEDTRSGFFATVQRASGGYILKHRVANSAPVQESMLPRAGSQMAASLVIPFMQYNFDKISKGQELSFDLVLPSRLESIHFQVRKSGSATVNGTNCITVALEPTSWLYRQLAPKTAFQIETAPPHRFIEYTGRLAVKDNSGGDMDGVSTAQYK